MRTRFGALTLLAFIASSATFPSARAQSTPTPLKPCSAGRGPAMAECGDLSVFENRTSKQGRKISIHFIVLRADQQPAHDALFMFAGGPGDGSTSMVSTANGWARPVRATMDVVLVDQRGTGQSHRLPCDQGSATDPAVGFGHLYDPARVRQCRAALEADTDLTQYTTDIAVQDVDDVRALLGYNKVSLYGGSYGTRIAQAYVRRYPNYVKANIIDGVVPFDMALPMTYAASAQQSLDRIFADCAKRPVCQSAHPKLAEDFATLLHRFDTGPVKTTVTPTGGTPMAVTMSRGDFGYGVRGILYAATAATTMPDVIGRAAASGDVSAFAQAYWSRQMSFNQSIAYGMHWSVLCAEDIPFATDKEIATATAGTYIGSYIMDEYRAACALWPRANIAKDFKTPVADRVPTLLVSGYFDPVTPPQFADRIALSLPLARTIVSPNSAHGSASGCPRAAVLHLMINGTFDGMPEACR